MNTLPKAFALCQRHGKFAIRAAGAGALCLVTVLMLTEIWNAWMEPAEYPFGAQGPAAALWAYRSQANYLLSCFMLCASCLLAIWALLAKRRSIWLRVVCAVPILIVWALMALDGSRLDL